MTILRQIGIVRIPETTFRFVARTMFLEGGQGVRVSIKQDRDNFSKWFLSGEGKIENSVRAHTLVCHQLLVSAGEAEIIAELGGNVDKLETTLAAMFYIMQKLGEVGGPGDVSLEGGRKIFFIKDQNDVFAPVTTFFHDDVWKVLAQTVEFSGGWEQGSLVFSPTEQVPCHFGGRHLIF